MNEDQRQQRRGTFGQTADSYDRVRPGYPQTLIDHLLAQARNFAAVSQVEIVEDRFEDYALGQHFDLVAAATSFHWLDPQTRCAQTAAALKSGGTLAILINAHPTPYTDFFSRVQEVYDRIVPQKARKGDTSGSETERWGLAMSDELLASNFFVDPLVIEKSWSHRMSSGDYIDLLATFSDHRLLPDDTRTALFAAQREITDREYGGYVERPYRSILCMAQRNERQNETPSTAQ